MRLRYCSLCGNTLPGIAFKGGYVCEECIDYIKSAPDDSKTSK